jgi:hypothetical protein
VKNLSRTFGALALAFVALRSLAQCPPATQPTKPADGTTTTEVRVNFAWNPAGSGVTGYTVWAAKDGAAYNTACNNSPSPNCTATLTPGNYEWYVTNYRTDCPNGTRSVHFHFTLAACSAPVAPPTLAPDNGIDVSPAGTTLTWSGGSADAYDVFLQQGTTCTSTVVLGHTTETSLATGALARGTTYAWRALASRGSTCPAPQLSHCATFRTRACDQPGAFTLTAPADGGRAASPVRFAWTTSGGANSYAVWSRTSASQPFSLTATTTSTSLAAVFAEDAQVEWYVEAAATGGCLTTSKHQTFTVPTCSVGATVGIAPSGTVAPANGITFRWIDASPRALYRVWLASAGGEPIAIDETTTLSTTRHLAAGSYDWYVETLSGGCGAGRSSTLHFVVSKAAACAVSPPSLTSPAAGSTVAGQVTFAWSAVSNATRYELWSSLNGAAPDRIATTTSTSFTTDVAPGNIRWFVIAASDGCDGLTSQSSSFTTTRSASCDGAAPQLIAPADGATRVPTSLDFFWTAVAGATEYRVWSAAEDGGPSLLLTTTATRGRATVGTGRIRWFVEAILANGCSSRRSAVGAFEAASSPCATPFAPSVAAPGSMPDGVPYSIRWTPLANVEQYEIIESTDGVTAKLSTVKDVVFTFQHAVTKPTRFFYRVRGLSTCGTEPGPFSADSSVVVTPASTETTVSFETTGTLTRFLFVPGQGSGTIFVTNANRPWLTMEPSSGLLPPEGITLTLRADLSALPIGNNVAIVGIAFGPVASGTKSSQGSSAITTPVSVSRITPVTPSPATGTTPGAMVLPAVAHFETGALFQSDVRLANTGPRPLRYQLNFTPTGGGGSKASQETTVQVEAGATIALDDVLRKFFGLSSAGESAFGTLTIIPLDTTTNGPQSPNVSFASSRTFAITPSGTAGQFIPALPLSKFIKQNGSLLLPQVAQSGAFRTNLGLVEASMQAAHVNLAVFDAAGAKIAGIPIDLQGGEHRQLNSLITSTGSLANAARIEAQVTSATGLVTAYASMLDQRSSDPILIDGLPLATLGTATRYVVPGVAALAAAGGGRWRSDIRIYNASGTPQSAKLTFVPEGRPGAAHDVTLTLAANEVRALDDVVSATFGESEAGGSMVITTDKPAALAATGRTYFDAGSGTFGQYIPALTSASGAALGDRPLQILQVEQSDRYRTNVGLVELTGKPVTAEVTVSAPESKVTAVLAVPLAAGEYRQLASLLTQLGLADIYNARISISVTSGGGRVGAYASVIDRLSSDPTYVPAQ